MSSHLSKLKFWRGKQAPADPSSGQEPRAETAHADRTGPDRQSITITRKTVAGLGTVNTI